MKIFYTLAVKLAALMLSVSAAGAVYSIDADWRFTKAPKTIPLDAAPKGKAFIAFETVRQSVCLWANGKFAGYYEAGIAPCAFDVTALRSLRGFQPRRGGRARTSAAP